MREGGRNVLDEIGLRVRTLIRNLIKILLHAIKPIPGTDRQSFPSPSKTPQGESKLKKASSHWCRSSPPPKVFPHSLKKPLQRACSILIPDHLMHNDLHNLLCLDPAVRVVAMLHLADFRPVVDLSHSECQQKNTLHFPVHLLVREKHGKGFAYAIDKRISEQVVEFSKLAER